MKKRRAFYKEPAEGIILIGVDPAVSAERSLERAAHDAFYRGFVMQPRFSMTAKKERCWCCYTQIYNHIIHICSRRYKKNERDRLLYLGHSK